MTVTLTDHPLWLRLLPFLYAPAYDRDGGHAHPRHRLEVHDPKDARLRALLLAIRIDCAAGCGRLIHPVRERDERAHTLYLAVSCDWRVTYGCSRTDAASDEYERIVEAVHGRVEVQQPTLWDAHE